MNNIIIRSVPNTGTNFLIDLFKKHNIKHTQTHYGTKYYDLYLNEQHNVNYDFPIIRGITVSPIREPYKQYISFTDRKLQYNLRACWEEFNYNYLTNNKLLILPIDIPYRDYYLKYVSDKLGVELHTDWGVKGSVKPRSIVEVPDLDWIYDLEVVQQFYKR